MVFYGWEAMKIVLLENNAKTISELTNDKEEKRSFAMTLFSKIIQGAYNCLYVGSVKVG